MVGEGVRVSRGAGKQGVGGGGGGARVVGQSMGREDGRRVRCVSEGLSSSRGLARQGKSKHLSCSYLICGRGLSGRGAIFAYSR